MSDACDHELAAQYIRRRVPDAVSVRTCSYTSFPDGEQTHGVLIGADAMEPLANVVGHPTLADAVKAAVAEAVNRVTNRVMPEE